MLTIVAILSILTILAILTILTIVAAVTVVTSGRDWFRQIRRFSPASAVLQESQKTQFPWTSNPFLGLPPLAMICSTTGVSQYTVRSKSQSVTNKFIVKYTEMVFVSSVLKMFPFGTPGQTFISAYTINYHTKPLQILHFGKI